MPTNCTRCEGSGFLNLHQIDDSTIETMENEDILEWIKQNSDHDVIMCDCCGDGNDWYGIPGQHYNNDDPQGSDGPYAYNGGLCECH